MKILVTGGTGLVGQRLTGALTGEGHEVTVLTRALRQRTALPRGASFLVGDPTRPGPWQERVAGHHAVVNLAGASIFAPWTARNKQRIIASRVLTTRNVVQALAGRQGEGVHFLSASGVGYYGHRRDDLLDEDGPRGDDFLAGLAAQWEGEALAARGIAARVVVCRFGHVLCREGGALPKLVLASRLHIGSTWGDGRQWLSWIHREDLVAVLLFVLGHLEVEGVINVTAPNPVRNGEMARLLAESLHKRMLVPSIPGSILKLLLGQFAGVFLNGQRVVPRRLLDHGYSFKYPTLEEALADLLWDRA
jgi:uncharacterized protein (TIGR01777 family)